VRVRMGNFSGDENTLLIKQQSKGTNEAGREGKGREGKGGCMRTQVTGLDRRTDRRTDRQTDRQADRLETGPWTGETWTE
jgi:hypothetical protein